MPGMNFVSDNEAATDDSLYQHNLFSLDYHPGLPEPRHSGFESGTLPPIAWTAAFSDLSAPVPAPTFHGGIVSTVSFRVKSGLSITGREAALLQESN